MGQRRTDRTVLHLLPDLEVGGGQVLALHTLRALPAAVRPVVCAVRDGPLRPAYQQGGIVVEIVGGGGPVRALDRTARIARREGAALIHTHHTATERVIGQATGLLGRLPVVNTFHGMAPPRRRGDVVRGVNVVLAHTNIRRFVAVSTAVAASYRAALRLRPDRITVVHPGLPPEAFEPAGAAAVERVRHELGVGASDRIVTVVARLVAGKGHLLALEALRVLLTDVPAARLVLVGDGPEREALRRAAERSGVAERVTFLGRRDDVPVLLGLADVVLSASDSEGFPLNVLEAMAAARPVVAARLPAYDDFVVDGRSGLLVPHEPRPMAEALRRVLEQPELAACLAEGGRRSAARFTTAASANRLAEVYERVLDRPPTGCAPSHRAT